MSIFETIKQRTNTAPRTSLGFWATMCGITFSGVAALVAALAYADAPIWLITVAVFFCMAIVVFVIGFVAVMNARSPEKLMLGTVTAVEFNKISQSRAALGDSRQAHPAIEEAIDADIVDDEAGDLEAGDVE